MSDNTYLVDTNILIRYITGGDILEVSTKCYNLFKKAEREEITLVILECVIAEVVYVLSSSDLYKFAHKDISDSLSALISLPNINTPNKSLCIDALNLYGQHNNLDFEDCFMAIYMKKYDIKSIYSYDKDFNKIKGIKRLEP